jgi:hypothetical protein
VSSFDVRVFAIRRRTGRRAFEGPWVEQASLPVSQLGGPRHPGCPDGLCTRPDGSPAAANTITRKRAVFHGAFGYAVEIGLLSASGSNVRR